jgi:hypothetical protein
MYYEFILLHIILVVVGILHRFCVDFSPPLPARTCPLPLILILVCPADGLVKHSLPFTPNNNKTMTPAY